MAFRLPDRVKETTDSTGTGNINLLGAVTGLMRFADANAVGDGNETAVMMDAGDGNWEAFFTTVTAGVPDTLSRGALIKSSTGARINFGAGTKTIAVMLLSELLMMVSGSAALAETDIASAATCDIGSVFTFRARITGTTGITSLGTAPNCLRWIRFAGILTMTHNAASLILLGAANRTTAAGDVGLYVSDAAGNWRELEYFSAAYNPGSHSGTGAFLHRVGADLSASNIPVGNVTGLGSGIAAHLADSVPFPAFTDTLIGTKRNQTVVAAGGSAAFTLPQDSAGFAIISGLNGVGYSTWFVAYDDAGSFVGVVLLGKAQAAGGVDPLANVVGNTAGNNTLTVTGDNSGGNVTITVKIIPTARN